MLQTVRGVLQSELNGKNKLEAINTLAILVVAYSFNVVNWNLEEIKRIDRKIRKQMTLKTECITAKYKLVECVFLEKKEDGE